MAVDADEQAYIAFASFCEDVMSHKEAAKRSREKDPLVNACRKPRRDEKTDRPGLNVRLHQFRKRSQPARGSGVWLIHYICDTISKYSRTKRTFVAGKLPVFGVSGKLVRHRVHSKARESFRRRIKILACHTFGLNFYKRSSSIFSTSQTWRPN